jgi:hypothetical protein
MMGACGRLFRFIAVFAAAFAFAQGAGAAFHLFKIEQIFSNADGTVQFVVLHESFGANGEQFLSNHQLKATHAGVTNSFTFLNNLPSSATAGRRVLIATQGFAALGIVAPDYVMPNGFLPTGAGTLNYAESSDIIGYGALPTDGVTAIARNGTAIPNVATNFAGQSASVAPAPAVFGNFQGLWWNDPDNSEPGWGVNLNHQDGTIFGTWFTFGLGGQPLWLVVTATAAPATPNVFTGNLLTFSGSRFDAFDQTKLVSAPAGSASFTFSDLNHATFDYTVSGAPRQIKPIKREPLNASPMPSCSWGVQPNLALATNYQDLWYAFPAESELGWGINFTHQGNTIFATWFTYGLDGQPLWLVVSLDNTPAQPNVYTGTLNKVISGPPFNAVPFDFGTIMFESEGTATLTFSDGNFATFDYSVDGIAQTKQITRDVFAPPGTVCQ